MQSNAKRFLRVGLITTFFLFILSYAFYQSYNLLFGVKIKNVNLENYATYPGLVEVVGNAKHATMLTINDREISINKEGDFSETIALLPGYNVVSIHAIDKFGHQDIKHYQLISK